MQTPMKRYWINAPSTPQRYNEYHGRRVLAPENLQPYRFVRVYFADNVSVISMNVSVQCLSEGWHERGLERLINPPFI